MQRDRNTIEGQLRALKLGKSWAHVVERCGEHGDVAYIWAMERAEEGSGKDSRPGRQQLSDRSFAVDKYTSMYNAYISSSSILIVYDFLVRGIFRLV